MTYSNILNRALSARVRPTEATEPQAALQLCGAKNSWAHRCGLAEGHRGQHICLHDMVKWTNTADQRPKDGTR